MSADRKPRDGEADYAIGYGKPPASTRFKPGQSGNPKGKQKGSRSFKTTIDAIFNEKIKVNTPRGVKKMTKLEAAIHKSMNNALMGDRKALDQVLRMAREAGLADGVAETLDALAMQHLNAEDVLILERYGLPRERADPDGSSE